MSIRATLNGILARGARMFAISFVGASTAGIAVLQQQVFRPDGTMNLKPALAAASAAFLIAFASSVLHLLERSSGASSEYDNTIPPKAPPKT